MHDCEEHLTDVVDENVALKALLAEARHVLIAYDGVVRFTDGRTIEATALIQRIDALLQRSKDGGR